MNTSSIEKASIALFLIVIFLLSVYAVKPFLDAIVVSAFFAYIASPLAGFLERITKSRTIAALIVVFLAILPLIIIGLQIAQLYTNEFHRLSSLSITLPFSGYINWDRVIALAYEEMNTRLNPEVILKSIGFTAELVIKIFIVIAGSFYMLRDRYNLREFLISLAPPRKKDVVEVFLDTSAKIFHGVFVGHLLTSLVVGCIAGAGYYIIGYAFNIKPLMNYPILIGSITAIAVLLPLIGAWLVYLPVGGILIATGEISAGITSLLFGFIALTLLPDFLIRPYVSSRYGKTHPYIVLLGFISGPMVFGAIGLILGPAILSLLEAALRTYRERMKI